MRKFNDHFIPKKNTIHEKAKFHQRKQKTGESAEQFIRALYEIAENCDFKDSKNDQIRDAIVIGISDRELSERMQLKDDLTLEIATTMARQSEVVKSQVRDQGHAAESADEVKGARPKYASNNSHPRGAPRRQPGNGHRQGRPPTTQGHRQPTTQGKKINKSTLYAMQQTSQPGIIVSSNGTDM